MTNLTKELYSSKTLQAIQNEAQIYFENYRECIVLMQKTTSDYTFKDYIEDVISSDDFEMHRVNDFIKNEDMNSLKEYIELLDKVIA